MDFCTFLQELLDRGRSFSIIKVYLAAISACHIGFNRVTPGAPGAIHKRSSLANTCGWVLLMFPEGEERIQSEVALSHSLSCEEWLSKKDDCDDRGYM